MNWRSDTSRGARTRPLRQRLMMAIAGTMTGAVALGVLPTVPELAAAATTTPAVDAYSTHVLDEQPGVYFRLDDTSGTTALDSATGVSDGTYSSGVTFQAAGAIVGDADTAVAQSTSGVSVLTSASAAVPAPGSPATLEVWIRSTSTTPEPIISEGGLSLWATGGPSLSLHAGSSAPLSVPTGSPYLDGAWHLVDVVYDGSNAFVYLDGQEVGSAAVGTISGAAGLTLGGLAGSYDEVAVYPRALPPSVVGSNWSAGQDETAPCAPPPATSGLQAALADHPLSLYPLDGLGDTPPSRVAWDVSGNCRNGTFGSVVTAATPGALDGDPATGASTTGNAAVMAVGGEGLPSGNQPRTLEIRTLVSASAPAPVLDVDGVVVSEGGGEIVLDAGTGSTESWTVGALGDGSWHLLDLALDGTTATLYVDGASVGSKNVPAMATRTAGGILDVGGQPGSFQDVGVYPTALTAAQVASHALAGRLASTHVIVSSSASPSAVGQQVTFTATVAATESGSGTPSGSVTFAVDGATSPVSVALSGGVATYSTSALTDGLHTLNVEYGGDGSFAQSSGSRSQLMTQVGDTTTTPDLPAW